MDKKNTANKILKEHKFKVTPARMEILSILSSSKKPMSAEEIFKKVVNNQINTVTVYRTLTSFEEKGIVRKVDLRKDAIFFELADTHHHHIVCKNCGEVEDVDVCLPVELHKAILVTSKKFKKIKDHSLEFFGQCKKCH